MRRFLCVLAVLALTAGCARRRTPAEAGRENGILLLGNGAEPQDLDPQICTAYTDGNILIALFEGLTCIDEATSQAVPGMAESWEASPDGTVYTFHLRSGITWSNGDPVTARDFVDSCRRILSPRLGAENAYLFFPLRHAEDYNAGRITEFGEVGVAAVDERTLRLTLAKPCPYLPALVANQAWLPIHRAAIEKFGVFDQRGSRWTRPENIVTNGAFLLREWSPGSRIVVDRNPRYWDAARNRLHSVVFYPNDNISVDENAFRAGQLHLTYDLLPERIEHYRREAPQFLRVDLLNESDFLRFNVKQPPLNDPRVRRALSRAIDRAALARQVLYGSRQAAYALTPPATGGYTPADGAPTDVGEARRLLAEAGYPGGRGFPRLEVQMWTDPINRQILEAIQQMWHRDLGIDVSLVNQEFRVYLDARRTLAYQISRSRWVGDYLDPSTYLDLFRSDGGNNQTGWANAEYDRLNDEAARTLDRPRRFALLRRAEALLLDQAPIAPLFFGTRTYLIQPYVHGWVPSLLGVHRYQYVWLEK